MANKKKPANKRPTKAQIAAREARRRRDRRNKIAAAIVIGVLVVGLAVLAVTTGKGENQDAAPIASAPTPGVQCTTDQKSDGVSEKGPHVKKKPTYEVSPPSGGDHSFDPAAPGIYNSGKVDDFKVIHALEHGYVAIWYRPGISDADLAVVENVWKNFKRDVLVIEQPSLPADQPVAATAWRNRLLCSGADGFKLGEFARKFINNGPEKVPHNVPTRGRDPRT